MAIQPKNDTEIRVDTINEKTGAAGITVDSVLIKDGAMRSSNNTWNTGRNAANSANVNAWKISSADELDLNITWKTWSPSFSCTGSMLIGSTSTIVARYCQLGKYVFFVLVGSGTLSGTASDSILFTLPVTAGFTTGGGPRFAVSLFTGGSTIAGVSGLSSSTQAAILNYLGSAHNLGAIQFNVTGFYEAA